MTVYGLNVLRLAATLVHALPGLAVRLRRDECTLLTACHPPVPLGGGRWMAPCPFRLAVGATLAHRQAGRTVGVLGLPPGIDPSVEIGARGAAAVHAGGVASALHANRFVHAFASLLPLDAARAVADDDHPIRVDVHHDAVTDVALVFTESGAHPSSANGAIVARMQDLLVRCAAAELATDLMPSASI
jgi:hypothetical protein